MVLVMRQVQELELTLEEKRMVQAMGQVREPVLELGQKRKELEQLLVKRRKEQQFEIVESRWE